MTDRFVSRDGDEIDALVIDRYLDALLAGVGDDDPAPHERATRLPPHLRAAVTRLAGELPRLHPSFRFEERLAVRLADVAATLRVPLAAGGEDVVVAFSRATEPSDPLLAGLLPDDEADDDRPDRVRPILIGGALTSAAISIAGAAYVAWRRTRPSTPMARAVRAVARGRLA